MSYLTCLECGGDTHTKKIGDKKTDGYTVQKVVCNYCDNEGQVIQWAGMNPRTQVHEGSFAELTDEGLKTLRDNLGFEAPVYVQ